MKRIIIISVVVLLLASGGTAFWIKQHYLQPIVKETTNLYIPTGTTLEGVQQLLDQKDLLIDRTSFAKMAELRQFNKVYPGRYLLDQGMNQWQVVAKLRSGKRETVRVTFNTIRFIEKLAGIVSKDIEADSTELWEVFNDKELLDSLGVEGDLFCYIIPNTYNFYWNTSAVEFMKRMVKEYHDFWDEERMAKAKKLNLTPCEVVTVASIVQEEQQRFPQEHSTIAGVYLNRVKDDKKLQADPTLKYLVKDFSVEPTNLHKLIPSPYNTYMFKGLPPGPIGIPASTTIDATLNAENHNYEFMCAKPDFSGLHNFAETYPEHQRNARAYQKANRQRKRNAE